jgi:hypothetical protein
MKRDTTLPVLVAAFCSALLLGCQSAPKAVDTGVGSGFLSDYARLQSAGGPRDRYLTYRDPAASGVRGSSVYLHPVSRHPAGARFEDVDEAVVAELLAFADAQLRAQLGARLKLVAAPASADIAVQAALTGVGSQPAGKTVLDVVPLRLITNPIKDATLGKALEAAATLEVRLSPAASSRPLRESLYHLTGEDIGRAADPKTRIDANALKPAIERWARALADQIATQP